MAPRAGRFRHGMARWIGWNFVFILIAFIFLPQWNLRFIQAIVVSFQNLVPSFTYYDLIMPFYMLFFFLTFWTWLRPSVVGRRSNA